jgi:predicted component of type VI protein secretion system
MRTTVDLAPKLHQRAVQHAREHGQSLSATLARLVAIGMETIEPTASVTTDPVSGFPTVTLGRRVTAKDVADLIDEDAK